MSDLYDALRTAVTRYLLSEGPYLGIATLTRVWLLYKLTRKALCV